MNEKNHKTEEMARSFVAQLNENNIELHEGFEVATMFYANLLLNIFQLPDVTLNEALQVIDLTAQSLKKCVEKEAKKMGKE